MLDQIAQERDGLKRVDYDIVEVNPLEDKNLNGEEITRMEAMLSENQGEAYKDFGKQLNYFKKSAGVYQKVASKAYNRIQKAEDGSKNFRKIQQEQEKFIARVTLNTNLPPVSKTSKLHEVSTEL